MVKAIAKGETVTTVCRCKKTGMTLRLSLRPACTDQLSPGKPVGVPSWVPSETDSDDSMGVDVDAIRVSDMDPELCSDVSRCFYFVVLQPVDLMGDSVTSVKPPSVPTPRISEDSYADEQGATNVSMGSGGSSGNDPATTTSSGGSGQGSGNSKEEVWLADGSETTYGDFHIPEDIRPYLTMGTMIGSGCFGKGQALAAPVLIGETRLPLATDLNPAVIPVGQCIVGSGGASQLPSK